MPATSHRDPRSIITPDAFEVSPALVGTPLASPSRRAVALLIDGIVIVMITGMTRSVPLLIGVVATALFVRAAFKRTPVRGSVFGRAMRFSVGCLGLFIGLVTAAVGVATLSDFGRDGTRAAAVESAMRVVEELDVLAEVESVESREDALDAAQALILTGEELGLPPDLVRRGLAGLAPDTATWAAGWVDAVDSLLALREGGGASQAPPTEELASEVAALSDSEVLSQYADLAARAELTEEELAEEELARLAVLTQRARTLVAGDTLEALERRVSALRGRAEAQRAELAEAESELESERNRGMVRRILDLAEDLGFGFGWAALYMTVVLAWWKGQTVGKRIMGIRVVRLDGEPITWWIAFERFGGYAAGLATGLLGFAQVWWDANRQAIHDRIVGTVVVREGADKVLDWESAL
jgi:uncharacterized RDD family membrane protein YckC